MRQVMLRGSRSRAYFSLGRGCLRQADHRHLPGHELAYRFTSPEQLIADFLSDVEKARRAR